MNDPETGLFKWPWVQLRQFVDALQSTDPHRPGSYVLISPYTLEPMPGTARIGLDSPTVLEITDNDGIGLFVADDSSMAEIDSRNLVFHNNAAGGIIGDVTDVAP